LKKPQDGLRDEMGLSNHRSGGLPFFDIHFL
jgi:hypothetical protein